MKYPCFKTTNRLNKKAVWVYFSRADRQNIWDLEEKELTDDVKAAIRYAFEIGYEKSKTDSLGAIIDIDSMLFAIPKDFEELNEEF